MWLKLSLFAEFTSAFAYMYISVTVRLFLSSKCHEEDPCAKDVGVICQNRSPGYWCPPCPKGYSGKEIHGIGLYFARNNKQVLKDPTFPVKSTFMLT